MVFWSAIYFCQLVTYDGEDIRIKIIMYYKISKILLPSTILLSNKCKYIIGEGGSKIYVLYTIILIYHVSH